MSTCPVHGLPWKQVPAGVSKAGKQYNSFMACPERGCRERPQNAPQPAPAERFTPAPTQTTPRHLLVIASLDFASRVYQGTAQDVGAVSLAQEVLRLFDPELL